MNIEGEGPGPRQVRCHQLDPELQGDRIGRSVAHRSGNERIQQRIARESETQQIAIERSGRDRKPGVGRRADRDAVADRAAVMDHLHRRDGASVRIGWPVSMPNTSTISLCNNQSSTTVVPSRKPSKTTVCTLNGVIVTESEQRSSRAGVLSIRNLAITAPSMTSMVALGGLVSRGQVVRPKSTATRSAPTIYDVARLAEVSSQTVSRYFNGFEGIRPTTRDKVAAAAKLLNYRPNLTARSLSTNKSLRLGALAHELSEVGGGKVVEAASATAADAGYLLDIISLDVRDSNSIERAMNLIDQHELAGIIAFAPTDALITAFGTNRFSVPIAIDSDQDDLSSSVPRSADGASVAAVVDYLVGLGHTKFAHVAGPEGWVSARNRRLGYERSLATHHLESRAIEHGDWSASSGYSIGSVLADTIDVTAVVVANDQMALGVMRAYQDAGTQVPSKVSIVGFDDIPEAKYLSPALTTVHQDFGAHGRDAINRLLAQIRGDTGTSQVISPPHPIIVRESSGSCF